MLLLKKIMNDCIAVRYLGEYSERPSYICSISRISEERFKLHPHAYDFYPGYILQSLTLEETAKALFEILYRRQAYAVGLNLSNSILNAFEHGSSISFDARKLGYDKFRLRNLKDDGALLAVVGEFAITKENGCFCLNKDGQPTERFTSFVDAVKASAGLTSYESAILLERNRYDDLFPILHDINKPTTYHKN